MTKDQLKALEAADGVLNVFRATAGLLRGIKPTLIKARQHHIITERELHDVAGTLDAILDLLSPYIFKDHELIKQILADPLPPAKL